MNTQLNEILKKVPQLPGVYFMKDQTGRILYIGASSKLRNRLYSYFREPRQEKIQVLMSKVHSIDFEIHPSVENAFLREQELIKIHKPPFNRQWTDDKSYPLIKITMNEKIPRILVVRKKENDGAVYIGRRVSADALRATLKELRRFFPTCVCKKPHTKPRKPCIEYQIKRCSAPCAGYISLESYRKVVYDLIEVLNGKTEDILNTLHEEMNAAVKELNFEKAAKIKERIEAIQKTTERNVIFTQERDLDIIVLNSYKDPLNDSTHLLLTVFFVKNDEIIHQEEFFLKDVVTSKIETLEALIKNFYYHSDHLPKKIAIPFSIPEQETVEQWLSKLKGETVLIQLHAELCGDNKKKLRWLEKKAQKRLLQRWEEEIYREHLRKTALKEIQAALHLKKPPYRIEGYDISNIQGTDPVGAMVVFIEGKPQRQLYRKFKIRRGDEPNDYAMIQETLERRLKHNEEGFEFPDLIVIDGGKGQLNAAVSILKKLNYDIPIIAIAKKREEIYVPGQKEPLPLPPNSRASLLIQQIRNEAHNTGVTFHRKLREKRYSSSILDKIPGVGKKRKIQLLNHFGSIQSLKKASIDEIATVDGISRKLAETIYIYLHVNPQMEEENN